MIASLRPEIPLWQQYQPFFPERLRITEANQPQEESWTWRRARIRLDRYGVPTAPVTVVLLHGGGGNAGLLAPYGAMLQRLGYEVIAPDLPGYGRTVAPIDMFRYDVWVECAAALADMEEKRTGRRNVFFGLSVGGYLAYLAAAHRGSAAGIIATTLADPREPIVRAQFARTPLLARLALPLLPMLDIALGDLRLPVRWLSKMSAIANDSALIDQINADPLAGGNRVPMRFPRSLFAVRPAIEPQDFNVCPVLLAQPAADQWTTLAASLPFFNRIRAKKELVMLENCGHLPIEAPGIGQLEEAMGRFLKGIVGG